MNEVEVTWKRAVKVWWSLFWKVALISVGLSFLIGMLLGFLGTAAGVAPTALRLISYLIGGAVGVFVGVAVLKSVLTKTFSDFRIVLVAKGQASVSGSQDKDS